MASVSTYLDKRRPKKSGEYPLKFNISINRGKKFLVNLNVDVLPGQWNGTEIVKHERKLLLNQYIRLRTTQIEDELMRLEATGLINSLSITQIKECIDSVFNRTTTQSNTIADYWRSIVKQKDRKATVEGYNNTLIKIGTFAELESLTFAMITPSWLRQFEQHMKSQELAVNTIFTHFRNLRAVFNRAIDDEVIGQECYPFRKFKIKTERTQKRSLAVEQLCVFRDYDCQEHQRRYRDIFMLMFYLLGINSVDLLGLKEIRDGRVEFRRAKTGRLYSIKIEPEAMEIIQRYRGEEYLLSVLDDYSNHKDFLHRMNKNLQQIGDVEMVDNAAKDPQFVKRNKKKLTPLFPELTTYWARHSWATIAAGLDIPKETIAAALGHGGNTVTDIYIDFDQRKVDEANRKVIDYLNEITIPEGVAVGK